MMDRNSDTTAELNEARPYESPVIRTHKRDELAARATPINANTSDFGPFDPDPP